MTADAGGGGPRVAVLDYGIGNLRSAEKALAHIGAAAHLVRDPDAVADAAGVVVPGVGAFGPCVAALRATGLDVAARQAIQSGVPFLGICVGFQILYEGSDESPDCAGLGVFPGTVRRLETALTVPQMQWNALARRRPASGLLAGLGPSPWVYFVHSYAPPVGEETVATCDYGGPVAAAGERGAVWGTQFHPEKSGTTGLSILSNFVSRCSAFAGSARGG